MSMLPERTDRKWSW